MEEIKGNVILTGFDKKEAAKLPDEDLQPCCYLCRRKDGSEGVYLFKGENGEGEGAKELEFEMFDIVNDGIMFEFLICHECQMLLGSIANRI